MSYLLKQFLLNLLRPFLSVNWLIQEPQGCSPAAQLTLRNVGSPSGEVARYSKNSPEEKLDSCNISCLSLKMP